MKFVLLLAVCGVLFAQQQIEITGDVRQPTVISADAFRALPRATVKTPGVEGEVVYEGVWLHDVLKRAGVPAAESLRGKALCSYVLVQAQDGYQVLFSLAELDPAFADNQVLIADTMNGSPLPAAQGHFRLVVPRDKPGARWVRMLAKIQVVQLIK